MHTHTGREGRKKSYNDLITALVLRGVKTEAVIQFCNILFRFETLLPAKHQQLILISLLFIGRPGAVTQKYWPCLMHMFKNI